MGSLQPIVLTSGLGPPTVVEYQGLFASATFANPGSSATGLMAKEPRACQSGSSALKTCASA